MLHLLDVDFYAGSNVVGFSAAKKVAGVFDVQVGAFLPKWHLNPMPGKKSASMPLEELQVTRGSGNSFVFSSMAFCPIVAAPEKIEDDVAFGAHFLRAIHSRHQLPP